MDLADELMTELENESGEDYEQQEDQSTEQAEVEGMEVTETLTLPEGGVAPAVELDQEQVDQMQLASVDAVSKVAKLTASKTMKDVLQVSTHILL